MGLSLDQGIDSPTTASRHHPRPLTCMDQHSWGILASPSLQRRLWPPHLKAKIVRPSLQVLAEKLQLSSERKLRFAMRAVQMHPRPWLPSRTVFPQKPPSEEAEDLCLVIGG